MALFSLARARSRHAPPARLDARSITSSRKARGAATSRLMMTGAQAFRAIATRRRVQTTAGSSLESSIPASIWNAMAIYQLDDTVPRIAASAWVADSAQVIGNVELDEEASVWFGCVLRGDNEPMRIGARCNVQDGAILHSDPGYPLTLSAGVSIAHQVMLHGCSIGEGTLVGMQAVVLNGARIGKFCLVGAGALVTSGKEFPDGSMILGSPAKVVRTLSAKQIEDLKRITDHYVDNARRFRAGLRRLA
jgi:carbonic anhydrase/acetyltransferase-like protein (isoleucine patch superfamily)